MFPIRASVAAVHGPDEPQSGPDEQEVAEIAKVEEDKRTPYQKRVMQLVSQKKDAVAKAAQAQADADAKVAAAEARAAEAAGKLAAKEAADKARDDQAELAAAKTAEDFQKIQARLQKERDDEKAQYEQKLRDQQADYDSKEAQRAQVALDRAGQSILLAMAVSHKMIDPRDVDLLDVDVELNPETFELTAEGKKTLDTEFEKFKKAKPHLFGDRKTTARTDNSRTPVRPPADGEARKPSPMELMAEGLRKLQG